MIVAKSFIRYHFTLAHRFASHPKLLSPPNLDQDPFDYEDQHLYIKLKTSLRHHPLNVP